VSSAQNYTEIIVSKIENILRSQKAALDQAAQKIYESLKGGAVWHLFGAGHSHMVVEEAFHRAGGLIPVNPWLEEYLMPHASPLRNGPLERLSGLAQVIFDIYKPRTGEVLTIISNSGINATAVEMAELAKKEKVTTVAITNLEHSKLAASRHPGKKKLFEVCDIVIDTGGVKGDAAINLPHLDVAVGPLSSILGSYIVNILAVSVCERYSQDGQAAPVYLSANLPGGDERNKNLEEKYRSRIKRL
jgi:uncharacterized phosphosugar-binding protein